MGVFSNLFNPSSGTAHNGPQPTPPAPAPVQQQSAAPAPAPEPAPADPVSQLDAFKSLWQTPTTADGKPVPLPADPLRQPIFNLDPNKVVESTSKMDFTAGIAPETFAKITAGGPEAAAAFAEALNAGIRQAVAGLTISNGQILNQALLENNTRITSTMPQHIKKVQLLEMGSDDPVLSHEAVQPLVNSLKQMAFTKNPNASPAEVNAQVANYLRGLGTALQETSPEVVQRKQVQAKNETDWSTFLS